VAKARTVPINGNVSLDGPGDTVDFDISADTVGAATFTLIGKVNSAPEGVRIAVEVLAYDSGSGFLQPDGAPSRTMAQFLGTGSVFTIHNARSLAPGYQVRFRQESGEAATVNVTIICFTDTVS
jgi:cold shock CspA family protein